MWKIKQRAQYDEETLISWENHFLSFKLISNDKNHFNFNNFLLYWFEICETPNMYTNSLKAFDESQKCKDGPTIWEG